MANRLQEAATDLLRTAGFVEQPDGSWRPGISTTAGIDTALPRDVAQMLGTSEAGLAQMRYRGTGPKFVKVGARKVLYRWSDVRAYLENNTCQRTDDPRGAGVA